MFEGCVPQCEDHGPWAFVGWCRYISTIGVDYGVKPCTVDGQVVRVIDFLTTERMLGRMGWMDCFFDGIHGSRIGVRHGTASVC